MKYDLQYYLRACILIGHSENAMKLEMNGILDDVAKDYCEKSHSSIAAVLNTLNERDNAGLSIPLINRTESAEKLSIMLGDMKRELLTYIQNNVPLPPSRPLFVAVDLTQGESYRLLAKSKVKKEISQSQQVLKFDIGKFDAMYEGEVPCCIMRII
jgi:hypothetical protein